MSIVRYRGFELLTVYEEDMEGPYIAVRGSHEYMIKPGSSGSGNLRRIDNLLGSLRERFKKESKTERKHIKHEGNRVFEDHGSG